MNESLKNNVSPPDFRATLVPIVNIVCNKMNIGHMVDFYCGNDPIMKHIKVDHPMKIQCYDPLIDRFKAAPVITEMVFFAIEAEAMSDEDVDSLLGEIEAITGTVALVAIKHTERPYQWWLRKMMDRFEIDTFQNYGTGFHMILSPNQERIVIQ